MNTTVGVQPQKKNDNIMQSDSTTGFIGFANLPKQVHRKLAKRGFEFTLMVVGESGLGKRTLINSLFQTNQNTQRPIPTVHEKFHQSIKLETSIINIEERGVKIRINIIDSPGYGDCLNGTDDYKTILNYIDNQFESYLNDESGLNRRNICDNRVHCLFYFISSLTRGLKPLDIKCMKALHRKVNIIPIIAKADALTSDELVQMKNLINEQIEHHQIVIYNIPECDSDEDEELKQKNIQLKGSLPFAVISSREIYENKGTKVHGRLYPWGLVDSEDSEYSDFLKLRTMLAIHMQDLQQITHEIHYENYRTEKLQLKKYLINEEKQKKLIEEKDQELRRMQDMLTKMQCQLTKQ